MHLLALLACSSGRVRGDPSDVDADDPDEATPSSTTPMPEATTPSTADTGGTAPEVEPSELEDTATQPDTGGPSEPDTEARPEPDTGGRPAPDTAGPEPDTGARPELDTAGPAPDTGGSPESDTADTGAVREDLEPLVARLTVDIDEGEYPLVVTFDSTSSDLGSGLVRYEWSFGDGAGADTASPVHTYLGRGDFDAVVTVFDDVTGLFSVAQLQIDVDTPDCPNGEVPVEWGIVDEDYEDLSGIAASRREPDLYWVVEDHTDELRVLDSAGLTVSEHDLPSDFEDLEDLSVVVDPTTGVSFLFVADIGDNDLVRDDIEVWVVEEPDPWVDNDLEPLKLELTYPDGPHDAETLLVDPLTLDVFVVTKYEPDEQSVYVKRAPHDDEGPFELEWLGAFSTLDLTPTAGDVSADGSRIIVRTYGHTARIWFRDGYEPFEQAFEEDPCEIEIDETSRGEGIAFTFDGWGVVTISEGQGVPLFYIGL